LAEGKIDNLHDVMISAQKANIKIETAVEVQQKALDAYNEIMRMQI
ncbi:MAG TPA: flagellar hook-basal body complex protein FliE, partial [Pseudogracilibacillus sp.]|nr:flagellar hook-basal body complex protein FliE [Pseudogracilibacillus sp.]